MERLSNGQVDLREWFAEEDICSGTGMPEDQYVIVSKSDVNAVDLLRYLSLGCGVCVHDYEFEKGGSPNGFSDSWVITNDDQIRIIEDMDFPNKGDK